AGPGHVVHLARESERGGGTRTRRARLAEPAHVLLAGLVVGTLSIVDAKGSHRSGGQETEHQRDRHQPPYPDHPVSGARPRAATRPFACPLCGTPRVRHLQSPLLRLCRSTSASAPSADHGPLLSWREERDVRAARASRAAGSRASAMPRAPAEAREKSAASA